MLSKVSSTTILGIDAYLVEVEVSISTGMPYFTIVGLPDAAVKESKDRVRAAVKNSGLFFCRDNLTVNLAPADTKKEGAGFDLPIAIGILSAMGYIPKEGLDDYVITGELSLDGDIKPVRGALSMAVDVRRRKKKGLILPEVNGQEAAVVDGCNVLPVKSLAHVVEFLSGRKEIKPLTVNLSEIFQRESRYCDDFSDVKGQAYVKRAIEVAAAGGHNAVLIGPPGGGKTMISKRIPSILPDISLEEALETTKIYSVAGLMNQYDTLVATRPFRSPHHTVSDVGLIGGGAYPKPGEVSLAHNGVLFLDELPEFQRNVLEVLRQPLEDGTVTISRAAMSLTFPTRFMLIAAMNPCPCGYFTDPTVPCKCSPVQIHRYRSRISGPLLDRIDIHIDVPKVKYQELASEDREEKSDAIRKRVNEARKIQQDRFKNEGFYNNAAMMTKHLKKYCRISTDSQKLMEMAINKFGLSARAYDRILKVARTIADLAKLDSIQSEHIAEAIQYRILDREFE